MVVEVAQELLLQAAAVSVRLCFVAAEAAVPAGPVVGAVGLNAPHPLNPKTGSSSSRPVRLSVQVLHSPSLHAHFPLQQSDF